MNLLEIGKIARVHGVKGEVKIMSYIDEPINQFKHIYIGQKRVNANILGVKSLNNDAYSLKIDIMPDIDTAQKFVNQSVYIDRNEYSKFEDKVYLSDLINCPVMNENGERLGDMIDFEDYGATVILTIKCGFNSYQIPYVEELINYNKEQQCFIMDENKFKDMRI